MHQKLFVVNFSEVNKSDIPLVGGKGANLGEMINKGFPVPPGFIVTADAYYLLIEKNNLQPQIKKLMGQFDPQDSTGLNEISKKVKKLILEAEVPAEINQQILEHYKKLNSGSQPALVAVRSSATAEDLPHASFAGQQETYLNVRGEKDLLEKVKQCWASLFEPRAIFYREEKDFDHFKVGIAVPVQRMVQSEVAGIMFTINPVSNDKNQIVIEAIYGLGEKIVQGTYTPDHYLVQKESWKILQKKVAFQEEEMTLADVGNQEIKLPESKQNKIKLTDEQIIELAQLGEKIQQHYRFPQDIEWTLEDGKLYIVQSRPVTTITLDSFEKNKDEISTEGLKLVLKGEPASPGVATGRIKILKSAKEINKLDDGEILVTDMTTPDFVPAMKKAVAIVTNQGGQTSHAAIVSRELGIPCVVGTETATIDLKTGQIMTVNGKEGTVYKGGKLAKKEKEEKKPEQLVKIPYSKLKPDLDITKTKIYVNLAEPELAASIAQRNVDGVGLLRAEFMIAQMGIHPRKLIKEKRQAEFVQGLVNNLKKFAKEFNPRPVIYRATDFKTNEYANLKGGQEFEKEEPNPMIGYRGASRYIEDAQVFELELQAIKEVREKHGFKNLWMMIPFVRTVKQLEDVKHIVAENGLRRGPNFQLWMMVEIPSNVIMLDKFIEAGIDGVSIGSNDLTMLILGVDRDNSRVANVYDERNEAVLWALEKTIKTCKKYGISCSICGQAPSTYPDLSKKLVQWGITSVSVSPDAIDITREIINKIERNLS
ncbi:phosphoenolpyruvate synthase [Patescibacteria group bacterium]|nr:phosphoenolpyruvate synthase [Patescibacteria group bacterium]